MSTASRCDIPSRNICCRKSGPQSMQTAVDSFSTIIDVRVRLSRGSFDLHTSHPHPMTGTPCDVPQPKTVIVIMMISRISSCRKGSDFYCPFLSFRSNKMYEKFNFRFAFFQDDFDTQRLKKLVITFQMTNDFLLFLCPIKVF